MGNDNFTDTLKAGTISVCGNKYVQVYAASFHWIGPFPLTPRVKHVRRSQPCSRKMAYLQNGHGRSQGEDQAQVQQEIG